MNDIYPEWSRFLRANVPKLMRELKAIRGTPSHQYGQGTQYSDIAYMNYYTREQREPEFVDYHVHSDIYGETSTDPVILNGARYNNDHMFKLILISNLQQDIVFSVHATEFLNPLDMKEDTNQLYSNLKLYSMGLPDSTDLLDRCRKIVWNWLQDCIHMKMAKDRSAIIKEELVASVWHPRRVEKWLEAGVAFESL